MAIKKENKRTITEYRENQRKFIEAEAARKDCSMSKYLRDLVDAEMIKRQKDGK